MTNLPQEFGSASGHLVQSHKTRGGQISIIPLPNYSISSPFSPGAGIAEPTESRDELWTGVS